MNRMKKRIAILGTAIFILFFSVSPIFAADYETTAFNVDVTVNENNSFEIEQTIDVVFPDPRHGLYAYIPYRGTAYREIDGKAVEQDYRAKISDISVPGFEFEKSYEGDYLLLKIGSEDLFVEGPQTYTIRYTYTLYDDGIESMDDVYLQLIPGNDQSGVTVGTFDIHMPKVFPTDSIRFQAGTFGGLDTNAVTYSVDGLDITGTLNRGLTPGEMVTLRVELPEGYFQNEATMLFPSLLMYFLILLAPALCFLLWVRFGRDDKIVKTVEFYAPSGISSADVGYIMDGSSDSKDLISLIIYWANEGYLTIEQKNKKDFTLIRQKSLPENAKTYELTLFNGLFASRPAAGLPR